MKEKELRLAIAYFGDLLPWGKMVVDFGVIYKRRRLDFVLSEVNNLYEAVLSKSLCSTRVEYIDLLKINFHKLIDDLSVYGDNYFLSDQAVALCRSLFLVEDEHKATSLAARPSDADISDLVNRLRIECDLDRTNDDADDLLASPLVLGLGPRCRTAILTAYLGYFYWDVLVRPVAGALSLETGPIVEILIDRISPDDAVSLTSKDPTRVLLGGAFAGFGGFFSRAIRENDYLWGRLHAVDRLFDILATTAPVGARDVIDFHALKKDAFERVIEEEAVRLSLIPDLVTEIRKVIYAL